MIRVTCAIIRNDEDEVLVVQRGEKTDHPFKWEFPGGKVQTGESEEECIIREIMEELSIEIVICYRMPEVEYDYGHKKIELIPFICDTLDELPLLSEHISFKWLAPGDLMTIDYSEADILVADQYIRNLDGNKAEWTELTDEDQSITDDRDLQRMVNQMMSMQEAEWIALSAIENPAIFRKLIGYSFMPDRKLSFRASWTLSKVCDKFPEMIYPYITEIIEGLKRIDNESTERSFLRIISLVDPERLSRRHHGILTDHCFNALASATSAIAVKAYSMEIIYQLALIYPELAHELVASVNMLQGEGSAGIIARGRIILKRLASKPKDRGSSQT